jgi:hypothetical protein
MRASLCSRRRSTRRCTPTGRLRGCRTQMAGRCSAHSSLKCAKPICIERRHRLAASSGMMPIPTAASAMRQTASKPFTRTRSFIVAPGRATWPATWRWTELSRGSPINSRSITSCKLTSRRFASGSFSATTSTKRSFRNGYFLTASDIATIGGNSYVSRTREKVAPSIDMVRSPSSNDRAASGHHETFHRTPVSSSESCHRRLATPWSRALAIGCTIVGWPFFSFLPSGPINWPPSTSGAVAA